MSESGVVGFQNITKIKNMTSFDKCPRSKFPVLSVTPWFLSVELLLSVFSFKRDQDENLGKFTYTYEPFYFSKKASFSRKPVL